MRVDCEGCAGCCIDWRALAPDGVALDHERRGDYAPLDDAYNLVPLSSDEVRTFLRHGLGDAMTPRLFVADDAESTSDVVTTSDVVSTSDVVTTSEADTPSDDRTVTVDGYDLAAVDGRPAFLVGLRTAPKPVAPFGADPAWLPTCVFLDPATLQCRIHGDERYPETCATYPAANLALDRETECERVEGTFGGTRLVDADVEERTAGRLRGLGALGGTVFVHPAPARLEGRVDRIADGSPTAGDRAEFVAVAAASSPGTPAVDDDRYEAAREQVLAAASWVGAAIDEWRRRAAGEPPDPSLGEAVEEHRGAPRTPGWDDAAVGVRGDDE